MVLALIALQALPSVGEAANYQRTLAFITTGNGHGFQWYDANQNKMVGFLEHPYRYLGPNPTDYKLEGNGRRNLAYDVYFGLRNAAGGGWLNQPDTASDPEYVDQSNIIHVASTLKGVSADAYYFAPFGFEGNAMIALLKAPGASDAFMLFNFHMGSKDRTNTYPNGEHVMAGDGGAVLETGPGGGVMAYVPLSGVDHADCQGVVGKITTGLGDNTSCAFDDVVPGFQRALGADGWFAVAIVYRDAPTGSEQTVGNQAVADIRTWAKMRAPDQILADARAEFETWRKPVPANVPLCTENERKLWRQGEAVLRMGQIREPNTTTRKNNGMIVASLPQGEWHTGWVRDAMYATVALARSGHLDEAKASLDFFLNAAPVGRYQSYVNNQPYRISVTRYFGSGEEEADWDTSGPNVEIDGWGIFMWAARQYVDASGDVAWLQSTAQFGATVYDAILGGVARPLEANLEPSGVVRADSSIWEVHQPGRHYAYTTLAAARGFCDMAALAGKAGRTGDIAHYQMLSAKIKATLPAAFVDPQMALGGSIEGLAQQKYYDGSVAEAFTWNLLADLQGSVARATIDLFNHLRVASGGFKRNNDGLSSYDNNEWILVDLRISDALRRTGHTVDADGYLSQVVDKAAVNFFLLPELYNAVAADGEIGKYAGSIPMVGYGGGAYILTLFDRAGQIEPNDCGDGHGMTLAAFACPGGVTTDDGGMIIGGDGGVIAGGDGGNGNGTGPGPVPYTAACFCQLGAPARTTGAGLLLTLPWLLLGARLVCRARAGRRP